jgi:CrcB protein
MKALYVALGTAIGAPARFLIDQYLRKFTTKPLGTLVVNVLGSFLLGFTLANQTYWHELVAIGFAGAFTTWSTFMLDLYLGFELKRYREVLLNLYGSLALGLLAAWCGILLAS